MLSWVSDVKVHVDPTNYCMLCMALSCDSPLGTGLANNIVQAHGFIHDDRGYVRRSHLR